MSVRIIHDAADSIAALYCSTSEHAFGPVFHDSNGPASEAASAFLGWLKTYTPPADHVEAFGWRGDARNLTPEGMEHAVATFRASRVAAAS